MPAMDRAAQFAPFAALTGHADVIRETARYTDTRVELDEDMGQELGRRLAILQEKLPMKPVITVTYFVPDLHKEGGFYRVYTGVPLKIRELENDIVFQDGTVVKISELIMLEGLEE